MKTKDYYRTNNYNVDHSTFGGLIHASDFNTEYKKEPKKNEGSSVAAGIASDMRFDRMCEANAINRDKNRKYKKGLTNG